MKMQRKAYLFALTAILFWATIGSAFKLSLRYMEPLMLLLISSFIATVALFITIILQKKLLLLQQLSAKKILTSAALGLLNPFLYYVVLLKAYDILPAQEAGTLNYIWPLVLVLLSIPMLKQKISPWSIVAILISFTGIMVISTHGALSSLHFSNPTGVALAVGSALFWALYWIISLKDKREAVTKLFLSFCFGLAYTIVLTVISGNFILPGWEGAAGAIYVGLFEMGITFVLWLKALQLSSTTAKVSNLIYLSPFFSLILIHFTVGEEILLSTIAGLIMIVTGILLQQYLKR